MRNAGALSAKLIEENIRSLPANLKHGAGKGATTGTVILAFPYDRGIILGADRQVSMMGRKIWRTNFPKIRQVGDFSAVAMCGTVTMCQWIPEIFETIIGQLETRLGSNLPLSTQTKIFGTLMRGLAHSLEFDAMADFIFAGLDPKEKTGTLLEFGSDGSKYEMEKSHLTNGSGYAEADAVLIEHFAKTESKQTNLKTASLLALKAIMRAAQKDLGVGDARLQSATLATIDAKVGFRLMPDAEVRKLVKEVGK